MRNQILDCVQNLSARVDALACRLGDCYLFCLCMDHVQYYFTTRRLLNKYPPAQAYKASAMRQDSERLKQPLYRRLRSSPDKQYTIYANDLTARSFPAVPASSFHVFTAEPFHGNKGSRGVNYFNSRVGPTSKRKPY